MKRFPAIFMFCALLFHVCPASGRDPASLKAADAVDESLALEVSAASLRGVAFLLEHQNPDGSWGRTPDAFRPVCSVLVRLRDRENAAGIRAALAKAEKIPPQKKKALRENSGRGAAPCAERSLRELAQACAAPMNAPLVRKEFPRWRSVIARALASSQNGDGSWGSGEMKFEATANALFAILIAVEQTF